MYPEVFESEEMENDVMKVKTKKQMNLPQLIEWAMVNEIKHKIFQSNPNFDGVTYKLGFDKGGDLYFEEALSPTLIFTVEVEKEITEDTWFPELLIRTIAGDYRLQKQGSINDFKHITFNDVEAFYILNDDLTMTLIWRDGKLIEE